MAEESRPMTRRERREMQEREAALAAERAEAPEAASEQGSAPTPEPPAAQSAPERPLTRKERRRLERLEQPMETWTAEEETAHTGQIPTVTPEVIAEQERLARERAEQAQREAETASQGIAIGNVTAESSLPNAAQPAAPEPEPERQPEQPAAPEPDTASAGIATGAAAAAQPPSEITTDEIETTPAQPAAGGIPEGLKHLFPAGSLQARAAAEAEAAAAAAQAEAEGQAPAPGFIGMQGLDAAEPGYQEPSTEIPLAATTPVRGVTAPAPDETVADVNAINGGAAPSQASAYLGFGAPEAEGAQSSEQQAPPTAPAFGAELPEQQAPAQPEAPQAPAQAEATAAAFGAPPVFDLSAPAQPETAQSAPLSFTQPEPPQPEPPSAPAPQSSAPSIDDLVTGAVQQAPATTGFGMTPLEQMAQTGQVPQVAEPKPLTEPMRLEGEPSAQEAEAPPTSMPTPQAPFGAAPQQEPAPDTPQHPVEAVAQAFPPSSGTPYVPPQQQPADTGLAAARTQVATTSVPVGNALVPSSGSIPMANPTTGSIPTVTGAIARPTVDLPPAGGLRHFSWVHFAVFGAVAFVLGIVLINVVQATG